MQALLVGYRAYQILELEVSKTVTEASFNKLPQGHADAIEVKNNGAKALKIRFNRLVNDAFTIEAGEKRSIPLKVNKIFASCPEAVSSSTIEIIGYVQ